MLRFAALLTATFAVLTLARVEGAALSSESVALAVECNATPETTTISNNTSLEITLVSITSLIEPRFREPFGVNLQLASGETITFITGSAARQPALTTAFIYADDDPSEGAEVVTNVGTLHTLCSPGRATIRLSRPSPSPVRDRPDYCPEHVASTFGGLNQICRAHEVEAARAAAGSVIVTPPSTGDAGLATN